MEYERIQKHPTQQLDKPRGGGGGALSPAKLRAIFLGGVVNKRRKEEGEIEAVRFCFRSNSGSEIDSRRASTSDECRDVDMVSNRSSTSSKIKSQDGEEQLVVDSDAVRRHVPLLSKPAPSKWDDAQKWIASPGSGRPGKVGGALTGKKSGGIGQGNRLPAAKVVLEVTEDVDTKQIDSGQRFPDTFLTVADPCTVVDEYTKPGFDAEKSITESSVIFNRHDSSNYQSATTFINPPPMLMSVSLRDIGTEMTPATSQEPSRTETPVGVETPNRSPSGSQPSTPRLPTTTSILADSVNCKVEQNKELSEKEIQMRTRKEIMLLGTKLGKTNIAAWARRQEEKDALKFPRSEPQQSIKTISEVRASAWEEAEKAKYQARFKREEMKIQAWEDHQKAKVEAEIRMLEVEVERKRAHAYNQLLKKQESIVQKAAGMRADVEARKCQNSATVADRAEYIRRTGRIPSTFFHLGLCCCW